MYPFKVKVFNICTGGVKTNLFPTMLKNIGANLPDDSIYLPIEGYYKKRQGFSDANAITAPEYAKQVVSAVEKARRSSWIWRGYFARTCWFLSTFFWREIFDTFMIGNFGLRELRKVVEEKKKKS